MLGCTLATNVLVDRNDVVAVTLTVVGQGKGLRTGGRSRDLYGVIARPNKLGRSSSGVMTLKRTHPPTAHRGCPPRWRSERYRTRIGYCVECSATREDRHFGTRHWWPRGILGDVSADARSFVAPINTRHSTNLGARCTDSVHCLRGIVAVAPIRHCCGQSSLYKQTGWPAGFEHDP